MRIHTKWIRKVILLHGANNLEALIADLLDGKMSVPVFFSYQKDIL